MDPVRWFGIPQLVLAFDGFAKCGDSSFDLPFAVENFTGQELFGNAQQIRSFVITKGGVGSDGRFGLHKRLLLGSRFGQVSLGSQSNSSGTMAQASSQR